MRARWSGAEPVLNQFTYHLVQNPQRDQGLNQVGELDYDTNTAAKGFFEKALEAAKNPDLAAKACFMAARCEQNAFRTRQEIDYAKRNYSVDPEPFEAEMKTLRREKYNVYLAKLAKQYNQTRFHKEMIRECATYSDFLVGK